jgi:hypothetical protein
MESRPVGRKYAEDIEAFCVGHPKGARRKKTADHVFKDDGAPGDKDQHARLSPSKPEDKPGGVDSGGRRHMARYDDDVADADYKAL